MENGIWVTRIRVRITRCQQLIRGFQSKLCGLSRFNRLNLRFLEGEWLMEQNKQLKKFNSMWHPLNTGNKLFR
jgi:hypothetical protein